MTSQSISDLVRNLQSARSPSEAERTRWVLERALVPNQVLQPGADELTRLVTDGLPGASVAGRAESWELLGQLAAGVCGPTAADEQVVRGVIAALKETAVAALGRVSSAVPEASDHLAVDVLDALLSVANDGARPEYVAALRKYAKRGPREMRRVGVVLDGPTGE